MDWALCQTFVAVADAGTFLGASRRLRTSHPTVSRAISVLEKQIGAKLFTRSKSGLALTPQGMRFRKHVEAMAVAALRAETAVSTKASQAQGVVKLSIGPMLATYWLMPHLTAYLKAHQNVTVELITHPFPVSVRRRDADIVMRFFRSGDENLVGRKIARVGLGFYASRSYAARCGLPEKRDDWKDHSVIGFVNEGSFAEFGRWSDHVTHRASVALRCSSPYEMLAATQAGVGICAMLRFIGDAQSDLVRVAPGKLSGTSDLWLLAHPDLIDLPQVRSLFDFVADRAKLDKTSLNAT